MILHERRKGCDSRHATEVTFGQGRKSCRFLRCLFVLQEELEFSEEAVTERMEADNGLERLRLRGPRH